MNRERKHMRLVSSLGRRGAPRRDAPDEGHDEELRSLLKSWDAPRAPETLDARLLASYREQAVPRQPFWKRALTMKLSVPVPVAAAALLAIALAVLFNVTRPSPVQSNEVTATPTAAQHVVVEKLVEVPVERERVVTRVVYLRRSPKAQRPAAQFARLPQGADANPREERVASTRRGIEGFKPAEEVKMRVIKGEQ